MTISPPQPAAPWGLYLHVPFCSGKCPYCDFYSVAARPLIPAFARALGRERALRAGGPFDTLYIGGGTPSLLPIGTLSKLAGLYPAASLTPDREFTMEANPEDVTREAAIAWRHLGVTRVSLGVQSLDDGDLSFLGRRHTADQCRRALDVLRAHGPAGLCLDLMYGLPGRAVSHWLSVLDAALAWEPEHVSCYQLTLEPETAFGRRAARGEIVGPEDEAARDLFLATSAHMTGHGYLHYEISNFARSADRVSRHNSGYWRRRPYLGLGPAAHSFDGRARWWNHRSVRRYIADLEEGRVPEADREVLSPTQAGLETILLGLRHLGGVSVTESWDAPAVRNLVETWTASGLAAREAARLRLTPLGWVVADRLALDLAAALFPE